MLNFLQKCRPPIPSNLKKENVGIWLGWTCKNDREVVREAATKGIDMNLVYLFLSQRQESNLEKAAEFLRNEVSCRFILLSDHIIVLYFLGNFMGK